MMDSQQLKKKKDTWKGVNKYVARDAEIQLKKAQAKERSVKSKTQSQTKKTTKK